MSKDTTLDVGGQANPIKKTNRVFVSKAIVNLNDKACFDLDQNEFWLIFHLARYANKDQQCWPSNATLCLDCKWSLKKLQGIKQSLIKKRYIKADARRVDSGGQSSNMYTITTPYVKTYLGGNTVTGGSSDGSYQGGKKLPMAPMSNGVYKVLSTEVLSTEVLNNEEITEYGVKGKFRITILKNYASDKPIVIHDLEEYFLKTNRLDQFEEAGMTKFQQFMEANPGNQFSDDGHLYNAFRKFHEKGQPAKGRSGNSSLV